LSRSKPAKGSSGAKPDTTASKPEKKNKKNIPRLEDFIKSRDYVGAITLLEVSPLRGYRTKDFKLKFRLY